jgi:hypothetical protein
MSERSMYIRNKSFNLFYVTEEPFMHLTVTCCSLICCVGGEKRVVTLAAAYHPVFRVIIYGPWISQASVT